MESYLSLCFSALSLAMSVLTLWYTAMRRGRVKMTQPTMIGLGFGDGIDKNQVFVRCMLFSTSARGSVIENMYARVKRGESAQNFSIWVHGRTNDMERGAGLTVNQNGITKNFHFLLRPDEPDFQLLPGGYEVEIYCRLLNRKNEVLLTKSTLSIPKELLSGEKNGVQFDWAPDSNRYIGHVARDRVSPAVSDLGSLVASLSATKIDQEVSK